MAKNTLKLLEGLSLKFFMEAVAKIYDIESYVVQRKIIAMIENNIKNNFPKFNIEIVSTTNACEVKD